MTNPYELLAQVDDLEYGPERVALAEDAVRQADLLGDEEAGYDTRMALIETVNMSGQAEKMFAAFAWCQDFALRNPDYVSDYALAWYHKWVLGAATQFPQIPLSRIRELHDSYARYAHKLGAGSGSIPYMGLNLALHLGDKAAAERAFTLWQWAKRDLLSDCPACEANTLLEYRLFLGDMDGALRQGERIIGGGMTCGHVPHTTYAALLRPLLRLGHTEQAHEYAARGREMVAGDPEFVASQAEHLEFLALTDPEAGLEWYTRHLPWAEQTRETGVRRDFHAAAGLLFSRLAQSGRTEVTLTLPAGVQNHQPSGVYRVFERQQTHSEEARRLARQFDERNGTGYQGQRVEETLSGAAWERVEV